jgi:hypothetical protein
LRKRCVRVAFDIEPSILLVDKGAIGLRLVLPSVFVAALEVLRSGARRNGVGETDEGTYRLGTLLPGVDKQQHPRTSFFLPQSRHPPSIE